MDKRGAFIIASRAAALAGNCSPRYVCPLCLRSFYENDYDRLTIEHVPAKALGGKPLVLTCAPCNSDAGFLLQSHQAEQVRQDKFWAGEIERTLNIEVDTKHGTIRGEVAYDGEGALNVKIHPKRMNPTEQEELAKNSEQLEYKSFQIGRFFSGDKARIADLRDAYLWIFARYGYRAVAIPAYDWIRDAIRKGETKRKKWSITIEDSSDEAAALGKVGPVIYWLDRPQGAFLVCNRGRGIILPSPFKPNPYVELDDDRANISVLPRYEHVPTSMRMGFDFSDNKTV